MNDNAQTHDSSHKEVSNAVFYHHNQTYYYSTSFLSFT